MDWLIIPGAIVSLIGLAGVILSAVRVARARREGLDDATLRARMEKILPLNLGALFLSVIGLIMVALGVFLA